MIFKDLTSRRLYLHCEECEWGWQDPERSSDAGAGFLTLDEEFESMPATREDIDEHGWTKYAAHDFDE
ncbi:MAG: hypothetical protein IPK74_22020 [Deltaproteobacteria bacterium]|nr:hypothetical protein [Deltaproteobacteria bacterium]